MASIPPAPSFFVLLRNYNPYTETTLPQLREAFGDYGEQVLEQFKRYYKANNSNNPVERLGEHYKQIDSELAGISDPGIVSGWINFFKTESQKVRNNALSKIGSPQFLTREFPSQLNHITTMENIYSNSVKPAVIDPNPKVPHLISTGIQLPGYIMMNLIYAGQVLGELFNANIGIAADNSAKNTDPHQGNLVPDDKHPDRITAAAAKFTQNALNFFGAAASYMAKNLGFNEYGVQNKNIGIPNPILTQSTTENQRIQVDISNHPNTRDIAKVERYKPTPV